jgi:hypothetical protein
MSPPEMQSGLNLGPEKHSPDRGDREQSPHNSHENVGKNKMNEMDRSDPVVPGP